VFDLDGTLVDSKADIAAACNHTLVAMGRAPLDEEVIARFVGDGARTLLARSLGLPPDEAAVDAALRLFHPYYAAHAAERTRWMPGATELLDALSALPLTLCTNKPRGATLALLEALGATARFAAIVAGGDGPLKPDPAAIAAAVAPVGVRPRDAWVVGDGKQDDEAGRAAMATTIGVLGGFTTEEELREAGPDRVVPSLHALVALADEARRARG
jgi:phosphoglycolate phosphatase